MISHPPPADPANNRTIRPGGPLLIVPASDPTDAERAEWFRGYDDADAEMQDECDYEEREDLRAARKGEWLNDDLSI